MIRFGFLCLCVIFAWPVLGQDSLTIEEQYQIEYQKRIRKSHINGFYIPSDLNDALRMLDEIVDQSGKQKFVAQEESFAVNNVYFSFGRWISLNWGMENGSRLTVALNKLDVSYPDDMVHLVMYSFHRHLNKQDLQIEELVKKIKEERRQREAEARNIDKDKP